MAFQRLSVRDGVKLKVSTVYDVSQPGHCDEQKNNYQLSFWMVVMFINDGSLALSTAL